MNGDFWKKYGTAILYGAFGVTGLGLFLFVARVTSSPRIGDTDIPDFHLRSGLGVAGYGQIQERPMVGWPSFDSDSSTSHKRPSRSGQGDSVESTSFKNKVTKGIR